jgi:hypothetical protein
VVTVFAFPPLHYAEGEAAAAEMLRKAEADVQVQQPLEPKQELELASAVTPAAAAAQPQAAGDVDTALQRITVGPTFMFLLFF